MALYTASMAPEKYLILSPCILARNHCTKEPHQSMVVKTSDPDSSVSHSTKAETLIDDCTVTHTHVKKPGRDLSAPTSSSNYRPKSTTNISTESRPLASPVHNNQHRNHATNTNRLPCHMDLDCLANVQCVRLLKSEPLTLHLPSLSSKVACLNEH